MAVYVDVFEGTGKGLFDSIEVLAYTGALGTGSDAASVVRGEFKGTFVVAAKNDRPLYNLVKLCHCLC